MAQTIRNLSELFEHELKDMYDAESKLVDALKTLVTETTDPVVKQAFEAHRQETQEQVRRLEKVFEMLNREPTRGEGCAGIDGLLEEKKSFSRKQPSPEILALFNLGAAAKTERYEITAYESLIHLAEGLQMTDAVRLFEQTLQEEQATLEKVRSFLQEQPRAGQGQAQPKRSV